MSGCSIHLRQDISEYGPARRLYFPAISDISRYEGKFMMKPLAICAAVVVLFVCSKPANAGGDDGPRGPVATSISEADAVFQVRYLTLA